MLYAFLYSLGGLLLGAGCISAAVALIYFRRSGRNTWVFQLGNLKIEITTATPGVILATIGFLIVLITRFTA